MESIKTFIMNLGSQHLVLLGGAAIFLVVILMGFAFLGPRETKDWAKRQALWIVLAAVCLYLAEPIAREIVGTLGGTF